MRVQWGELRRFTFWRDVLERTARTGVQATAAAVIAGGLLHHFIHNTLWTLWMEAVQIGVAAAVLCVLTGLGSIFVPGNDPRTGSMLSAPKQPPGG